MINCVRSFAATIVVSFTAITVGLLLFKYFIFKTLRFNFVKIWKSIYKSWWRRLLSNFTKSIVTKSLSGKNRQYWHLLPVLTNSTDTLCRYSRTVLTLSAGTHAQYWHPLLVLTHSTDTLCRYLCTVLTPSVGTHAQYWHPLSVLTHSTDTLCRYSHTVLTPSVGTHNISSIGTLLHLIIQQTLIFTVSMFRINLSAAELQIGRLAFMLCCFKSFAFPKAL